MVGDRCYKCGTSEEISIKKRGRSGLLVFICRTCRRADWHRRKHVIVDKPSKEFLSEQDEWNLRAFKSLERISQKYAVE